MGRARKKMITPKQFHKLWDSSCGYENSNDYVRNTIRVFKYQSCDMEYEEAVTLLLDIHKMSKMTFRDILERSGMRKCEVSDNYCIPIRTVEEWYSGNNKCPGYFRLILLKDLKLFDIGVNIGNKKKEKEEKSDDSMIKRSEHIRDLLEKTSYLAR